MDSNTSRRQGGAPRSRGGPRERSTDTMRGAMSPSARPDLDSAAQTASPSNNLDQVREILFGAFYRDFERKLGRLESLVTSQTDELRTDTKRLVQVLESHVKRETDAMSAERESDRAAQMEAMAQLDQRLKKLEDGLARAQRDFRQQMLDEGKAFLEQTRRVRDEVVTMLHRELAMYVGESQESAPSSGVAEVSRLPEARTGEE
jgi:hypothetical protein